MYFALTLSFSPGFISGRLSELWEEGKQSLSVCILLFATILVKTERLIDSSLSRLSKASLGPACLCLD